MRSADLSRKEIASMCNSIRFFFLVATLAVATAQNPQDAVSRARARAAELRSAATATPAPAPAPAAASATPAPAAATSAPVAEPTPAAAPAIDENQIRRVVGEETERFASREGLERMNGRLIAVEGKIMTMTAVFITAIVIIVLTLLFRFVFRRSTPPPPAPDSDPDEHSDADADSQPDNPSTPNRGVTRVVTHGALALLAFWGLTVSGYSQTPPAPTAADVADALSLSADAADGVKALRGQVTTLKLVLEGLACPTGDSNCLTAFRRQAWGSGRGTSAQAGAGIRAAVINDAVSDPRLKQAFAEALEAFGKKLPASAAPAAVDLKPVTDRLDKLEDGQAGLGRRVDSVATTANEAKAEATAAKAAAADAVAKAAALRQLLAERGPRGIRKALKTPPPPQAAAPAPREKGPGFKAADKK